MSRRLWPLLAGFVIWAVAFVVLYAVQALGCAWGWPPAVHRGVLLAIWSLTVGLLGATLYRQWRRQPGENAAMRQARVLATAAAIAATLATFFPASFVSLCL